MIRFSDPIGFKCLDERDMMDYWENKDLTENWILEIIEGGWLDLEKKRAFISDKIFKLREILIEGNVDCISIFVTEEPEIISIKIGK